MTLARWLLAGCLALVSSGANAQDLFLRGGRLVDPDAAEPRVGNLLILDGTIVGSADAPPDGFTGTTVDLSGKWLIPGLTELHTHSHGNNAPGVGRVDSPDTAVIARRLLYAGVTGFLDLFAPEDAILPLRDRQRSSGLLGADIFAAGPCFTASEGHCTEYGVPTRIFDTPAQAEAEVGELAAKRPDVIKIIYDHAPGRRPSIDQRSLAAAIRTASRHGLQTVVHVGTWQDVREAVLAGARATTHVPTGPIPADLPTLMREHGVYSIPTLAVHTDLAPFVEQPDLLAGPMPVSLAPPAILNAYREAGALEHVRASMDKKRREAPEIFESVRRMAKGGVRILLGTDSGNWGTLQGYSVHRELEKLVEAGLSPLEALAAGTTRAGEFLGREYGLGSGDEANLVVLDASPVSDIRNTQQIHMVIHHGRIVDRDALLESSPVD